jgi:excinuclease ABC subunit A
MDHLSGLPPTVAIEQRISQGGRKSTVATITEVWNFVRLLYAKLGVRYCCGLPVQKQSISAMEQSLRAHLKLGPLRIFAPLIRGRKGYHTEIAEWALKHGYTTLLVDKKIVSAEGFQRLERFKEHDIDVLIAEVKSTKDDLAKLLEKALHVGKGTIRILTAEKKFHLLSSSQSCSICGTSYEDLDPRHFSFNSPHGWCTECRGYGMVPRKRQYLDLAKFDSVLAAEVDAERTIERMDDMGASTIGIVERWSFVDNAWAPVGRIELMFSHLDQNRAGTEFPEENFVFGENFRTLLEGAGLKKFVT